MSLSSDDRTAETIREDKVLAKFRPLRVWPALLLVVVMIAARFIPAYLEGGLSTYWMIAVFGPFLCCVLMLIWWLAFSRATWKERLFGLVGLIASLGVTLALVDPTMRGPGTTYLTLPMGMILFALGAGLFRAQRPVIRTGATLLFALVGFGFSILLRNEGMTGAYVMGTHWRWSPTPEASMLATRKEEASTKPNSLDSGRIGRALVNPEWPGFRGADRTSRFHGPQISTNWTAQPPRQIWKVPVGPAWSSFAVADHMLFTQEQRGPMETVVCYDSETGREVWKREVETRFDDPLGGPGPRATPTIATGGVFTMGATGILLRLAPLTGEILWKQDVGVVAGRKVPMWGFSASPLIVGSNAVVYAGGADKGLLAFDATSGALRWSAAAGNESYSSPQLNTMAGEELILMLSDDSVVAVDPATGRERLNYRWKTAAYRALQPILVTEDTVLMPTGMNFGTRAVRVTKANGNLAAEEVWTSKSLKPDFTDIVAYKGYAYGIDGGIFTCIDLNNGERKWKGGRYGKGQTLLLENSGLLLILAEDGRVVLLKADPNEPVEVASFKALEGKTWNHPVLVGDKLYVRNSQEAAAFQLPLETLKAAMN